MHRCWFGASAAVLASWLLAAFAVEVGAAASSASLSAAEHNALMAIYNATGGAEWNRRLNLTDPCQSTNLIICQATDSNTTTIIELHLRNNNMDGILPDIFGDFPNLQKLEMDENYICGSIPASMGSLPELTLLELSQNLFNGTLPSSLGNLAKINYLFVNDNNLDGDIPSELGNLESLLCLDLGENWFTGQIPSSFQNLKKLEYLSLWENLLSGDLSTQFPTTLSQLQCLYLDYNEFTGSLPEVAASILVLAASENHLSGTVPSSYLQLKSLLAVDLSNNGLSGSMPLFPSLDLVFLDLHQNQFTGAIPDYSGYSHLEQLGFAENPIDCPIPPYYQWASVYTDYDNFESKGCYAESETGSGSDKGNLALALGLGIGIPLGLAAIIFGALFGYYYVRFRRTGYRSHGVDLGSSE